MNNLRRIMFFACIVALVGTTMMPTRAYLQSEVKKSEVKSSLNAESPSKVGTQVDWNRFFEMRERVDSLTPEELRLYKKWLDLVESGQDPADQPYAIPLAPPANDDCAMATTVAVPSTTTQDPTAESTTAVTDPLIPCGFGGPAQHSRTTWVTFTLATAQLITIDTNASTKTDTVLAVWCGAPGTVCPTPSVLIACDDDSGTGFRSLVTFAAKPGPYLVELADFGGPSSGNYVVNIASVALLTPANDDCAAATAVTFTTRGGVFMQCVDTSGTTDECGETSCVAGARRSIWYKVTAGKNGFLDLGTFGAVGVQSTTYDTIIEVRTACPPGGTVIACNDDFGGDLRSRVTIPVVAGQMVWVRVAGFGGDTGTACVRFVNF